MAKAGKQATTFDPQPWKIILVGTFAEDYLVDIAYGVVKNAAEGLVTNVDKDILVWKAKETEFKMSTAPNAAGISGICRNSEESKRQEGDGKSVTESIPWGGDYKVLPLFICRWMSEFHKSGLKCPYEFVIEKKDLFDREKYKAEDILRQRIEILKSQTQSENGISLETFKDWMSGVMRKYLFLDDTAHGISGYIDPKDTNWNWRQWFEKEHECKLWQARFSTGDADEQDPLKYLKPLMKALWPEYFSGMIAALPANYDSGIDGELNRIYNIGQKGKDYQDKDLLPLSQGDRVRFVTPTGKINVLLIDDDAAKSVLLDPDTYRYFNKTRENANANSQNFNSSLQSRDWKTEARTREYNKLAPPKKLAYEEAWRRFDDIFSVQPLALTPKDFPKFEGWLRDILKKYLSYDFALVDLCFGEEPGQDPLGYHVIKKLAKLFPHMPIVVYSRYKDMGHIMRAFQCGAMWFLEKGEEQKLARHLMEVVKKGSWKREWRAMQDYNPVEFIYNGRDQAFDDKFRNTPSWQYLTAKCLEYLPGKFIEVKKMGGGISTASTFSVQKGLKLDGNPLQSPMIIKIDTAPNTRMEYERYFRYIRPYMANEAGRIEKPGVIVDRKRSAIIYTFAGRQDNAHALDSMKNMLKADIVFKASCDYEKYRKAFDMIFDEILPKIHRVTPNREFGDGEENKHQEVFSRPEALDAGNAKGAAFPNLQFGEVAEKDFYLTYLVRYPHFGKKDLTNARFVKQPTFRIENGGITLDRDNSDVHPYEFHDVWVNEDGSVDLEVCDCKDHDRKPYLLTGPIATHVAKFRQQMYPGRTLWVGKKSVNNETDGLMAGKRVEMFEDRIGGDSENMSWMERVRQYSETTLESRAGREYFALVDKVRLFCKALHGTIMDEELERFLWPDENRQYIFKEDVQGTANSEPRFSESKNFFENIRSRFKCPIAICHGDLNYGNIMLESRKHPPKDEKPDVSQTITDAWLIDFARTRRDLIAHDFNVMFTDTFGWLFDTRLFDADKNVKDAKEKYETRLNEILPRFIRDVMFAENSNPPDYLENDARFVFVYKILRRIRKAALGAGISEEMYTLTTVLECLLTLKLHLNKNVKNIRASAALFAVAKICFEQLCEDVELDLLSMDIDGKTSKEMKTQP